MVRKILITLVAAVALVIPVANKTSAQAGGCTGSLNTVCGPYSYSQSTWSNGYNTYVTDQDVGCGGDTSVCDDQLAATDPGNWSLTTNMNAPASYCSQVRTYPDIQQLTQNADTTDIQVSQWKVIRSTFAITAPAVGAYEFAYDLWFSNPGQEVMIWVYTQNHDHGGTLAGTANIFGQRFHVYTYGPPSNPGEIIVKLDANELSGTAHIKAVVNWLIKHGWLASTETIAQINFGAEVCGTGGQPETLGVSSYSLTGVHS